MKLLTTITLLPFFLFCQDDLFIDLNNVEYVSKLANDDNLIEPEYFELMINSESVIIDSHGKCKDLHFTINVDSCCRIESLQYYQTDTSMIYFHIVDTDGDAAGSWIIKFNLDTKEEIWNINAGGFNAQNFILYEGSIYLNSIGFIGKLDVETGKYLWKHDDLYEKYRANYFKNIIIHEKTVEGFFYNESDKDWIIVIDRTTGELIELFKNGL